MCMSMVSLGNGSLLTDYARNESASAAGVVSVADPCIYTCTIGNLTTTAFDIVVTRSAAVTNTISFTLTAQA